MGSKPFADKIYYRIGEVGRITGVKPHVLRYWESEFKEIRPLKSRSLQRLYRKRDLELILEIRRLLYDEGYTIAGAKPKIRELARSGGRQNKPGIDREKLQEFFVDLKAELEGIRQILE
ncbi:MAG: MerR family transcriptional regulator [Deltaproteobacteria bacterium]|nr:MerR family transcriptional regulator [Deltaproteobacteria bacterium]MBW2122108.1 MerR family transcriptional regulator [Deltaproteobacteria bacterium]